MTDIRAAFDVALVAAASLLPAPPALDLPVYAFALCRCYHTARMTPALLRRAAETFDVLGDEPAAALAREKADEETGHAALAVRDLDALGLPAADLVRATIPPRAEAFARWLARLAHAALPYGVFGYCYGLERIATLIGPEQIAAAQALGGPVDVTRFQRVHSAVGSDPDHVARLEAFAAGLSDNHRRAVAEATQESVMLYFAGPDETRSLAAFRARLAAPTAPAAHTIGEAA